MGNLAEERALLGNRNCSESLDCGTAFRLVWAIESEIGKLTDHTKVRFQEMQVEINVFKSRIEALEESEKQIEALIDLQSFREWLDSLKIKKPVPTDKDRPFRVGDTIALCDHGDIRIVLEIKSDKFMRLMNVPDGYIQENCISSQYTLIYHPGSPKPEPTVKEKIATDKNGKPPGGLKEGDVISCKGISEGRIWGAFHHQEGDMVYGYFQDFAGNFRDCLDWTQKPITFEFRPRFPDRKER